MSNLFLPILLISAAVGILIIFVVRGQTAQASTIKFPFLEIKLSNFEQLTPVKMFYRVSMAVINPTKIKADTNVELNEGEFSPVILIHVGWNIVCEAFIDKFKLYPNDKNIESAAAIIGVQNADFIRMYRDIHKASIQHSESVKRSIAFNYLVRAPSLAERINCGYIDIYQNDLMLRLIQFSSTQIGEGVLLESI